MGYTDTTSLVDGDLAQGLPMAGVCDAYVVRVDRASSARVAGSFASSRAYVQRHSHLKKPRRAGAFGTAALEEAAALRPRADVVVALGHCGYDFDVEIAKSPVIDAVVGGHTHLVRHRSSFNDRPVVLQAGAAAFWCCQRFLFWQRRRALLSPKPPTSHQKYQL